MTDIFPAEVFAVVMQRIIDSTSLPLLFMRTVSLGARLVSGIVLNKRSKIGSASGYDIQIVGWLCVYDATFPFDHEKSLDESATLGGIHEVCKDYRPSELFRSYAAAAGAAQGNPR